LEVGGRGKKEKILPKTRGKSDQGGSQTLQDQWRAGESA